MKSDKNLTIKMFGGFEYLDDYLSVNTKSLDEICRSFGTPCYVYSANRIETNVNRLRKVLEGISNEVLICFAMKANSNLSVIKFLSDLNCGVDCVSMGEIKRALKVGVHPNRIVFSGIGKTKNELEFAVKQNIMQINVESVEELGELSEIAIRIGQVAQIAIRVNTQTDAETHKYLSTGRKCDKFGVDFREVVDACLKYKHTEQSYIEIVGLSCHIGSQISTVEVYAKAFHRMNDMMKALHSVGITIKTLDLGGGIGIAYRDDEKTVDLQAYGDLLRNVCKFWPTVKLILEPGRFLVADAGCLLSQVVRVKNCQEKQFLIIDAGMNDLIRPCLYQAYHQVLPIRFSKDRSEATKMYDVVGPVCESADYFCVDAKLPELQAGDYVAVMNAGAYGSSMASRYNSRQMPAEVLVHGQNVHLIGERETLNDALAREKVVELACSDYL